MAESTEKKIRKFLQVGTLECMILCVVLAIIVGILFITIGFWKTLLITALVLVALFIGGETATAICTWIYKSFIPVIIKASTILILFGLLTMYLAGEKALVPGKKASSEEGEK